MKKAKAKKYRKIRKRKESYIFTEECGKYEMLSNVSKKSSEKEFLRENLILKSNSFKRDVEHINE